MREMSPRGRRSYASRRWCLLALLAVSACGDNSTPDGVALAASDELYVVAHQDDDLLFMQPELLESVQRGTALTTVYITAGSVDLVEAELRYDGLRSAYGAAAGANDWRCGWIEIEGHIAEHCRHAEQPISLVFLGYPDGGKEGEQPTSLLRLWEGTIDSASTIAARPASYQREDLIATLTRIIRETNPATIRTLEVASTHGRDHADHMIAGALTVLAMARAASQADLISYRGYSTEFQPPNKLPIVFDAARQMISRYEACVGGCDVACGDACTSIAEMHATWLARRYAIGFRRRAGGRLRSGSLCLAPNAAALALVDCNTAPGWRLDSGGELRSDDGRCIVTQPSGDLELADCVGGAERRVVVDDEGHIWSGLPPAPEAGMDYAHLWCLTPAASGARMQLCGVDRAPAWDFVPRTITTQRSDLALAATGREVRLGDLTGDGHADLCAIESGLVCAAGNGKGGFGAATRIDNIALPLAIDPKSLTLGDVDGDHVLDACGRDAEGVVCATAASQFSAARWSPSFNDDVARAGTSASLTALDANADGVAEICGLDLTGVVCAPHGLTLQPIVRSAWPQPTSVLWPADLDGDQQADWCSATDDGPMCGVEAQRELTTDGAPWGYAETGMIDVVPATTVTVAVGDIDVDGRADLCNTRDDRVVCARSQGRAFGPHTTTVAILPDQTAATALWLGDLDGDGRADACVDTGAAIVCAIEPAP